MNECNWPCMHVFTVLYIRYCTRRLYVLTVNTLVNNSLTIKNLEVHNYKMKVMNCVGPLIVKYVYNCMF